MINFFKIMRSFVSLTEYLIIEMDCKILKGLHP